MSAAGILNAKMEKVFGWVRSHASGAGGGGHKNGAVKAQPRSRSQDGLELRDFPRVGANDAELALRDNGVVDFGIGSGAVSSPRPPPALDLLPPFYHDKSAHPNFHHPAHLIHPATPRLPTHTSTSFIASDDASRQKKPLRPTASASSTASSTHIYEEIREGLNSKSRVAGAANHGVNPATPATPRYQEFLASDSLPQNSHQLLHLLGHKRVVEKRVAFDLSADDAAAAVAARRLDESQRSNSYGQLPKELLVSSGGGGPRDPALLLDIQTLEALRGLHLKSGADAASGRYVRAKSASPGMTAAATSQDPRLSIDVAESRVSPRLDKAPSPRTSPRHSPQCPLSDARHASILQTEAQSQAQPQHQSRLPQPQSRSRLQQQQQQRQQLSQNDPRFCDKLDSDSTRVCQGRRQSPSFPSSSPSIPVPTFIPASDPTSVPSVLPPTATPLHILPGYEVPFNAARGSLTPPTYVRRQSDAAAPAASFSPEEPNYRSELAKIERNLLHKNAVSTMIELETALERVKEEVRFQGQLLGPGELPVARAPRCGGGGRRGKRRGRDKKSRSSSCDGVVDGETSTTSKPRQKASTPKNKRLDKLSCRATDRPAGELLLRIDRGSADSPATAAATAAPLKPIDESAGALSRDPALPASFLLYKAYEGRAGRNVYRNKFLNELIRANDARM